MTVYVMVQLRITGRAADDQRARDRDELVLTSFPGIRLAAWKCARLAVCAYSDRKTGVHFCGIRASGLAGMSGNLERPKRRRAGRRAAGEGICPLTIVRRYHHGPNPNPKTNGYGAGA